MVRYDIRVKRCSVLLFLYCFTKINAKFVLFVFIPILHDVNLAILRNTMGVLSGAGSSYLFGTPDFNLIFLVSSHCSISQILVFCVEFCRQLFVHLSCFFWPLHCLSFDMHASSDPLPFAIFILIYCKPYTHYRHLLESVIHEILVIIFVYLWTFVVSYPDYSIVHLSLIWNTLDLREISAKQTTECLCEKTYNSINFFITIEVANNLIWILFMSTYIICL